MDLLNKEDYLKARLQRWRELKLELISFKVAMLVIASVFVLVLVIFSRFANAGSLEAISGIIATAVSGLITIGAKAYKDTRRYREDKE